MASSNLDSLPAVTRDDLRSALARAWPDFARPGAWLDGEQRLAAAREARRAWDCRLCQRRKEALSPYNIEGEHDHGGELPEAWVEVVHRVVTDSGRITERWYDSIIAAGVIEDEFIELLNLATMLTCVDTFTRAIDAAEFPLPGSAESGTAPRKRPGGVENGPGWAPTVAPDKAGPELGDFYANGPQYIRRALTLVPDEAKRFWSLMNTLYMANPAVDELEGYERAISRAQIEFIATRVSAYLDCFY